jgi:hypothetical protein
MYTTSKCITQACPSVSTMTPVSEPWHVGRSGSPLGSAVPNAVLVCFFDPLTSSSSVGLPHHLCGEQHPRAPAVYHDEFIPCTSDLLCTGDRCQAPTMAVLPQLTYGRCGTLRPVNNGYLSSALPVSSSRRSIQTSDLPRHRAGLAAALDSRSIGSGRYARWPSLPALRASGLFVLLPRYTLTLTRASRSHPP